MFTGLIETVGTISQATRHRNYLTLSVVAIFPDEPIKIGDSIACDGTCLTVTEIGAKSFTADVSQETVDKTTLGELRTGQNVNLERALKLGDRLGGHFVTGHIDDIGIVDYLKPIGESVELALRFDPQYDCLVVNKGSIAVNGISLTVNRTSSGWMSVNIIPHTETKTNLSDLKSSHHVNLEFDLIGKHVAKGHSVHNINTLTRAKLKESGW